MKTTNETKFAKGTIGAAVAKLVKRYAHYPAGLTILEMALEQAANVSQIEYRAHDGSKVYLTKTEGYKSASLEEAKCFGRLGCIFFDEQLSIAKKYTPEGTVVAIRFAKGMTRDQMEADLKRNPPTPVAWTAYNEATNEFTW